MPTFSKSSLNSLHSADGRLQRLFKEVIKHFDCKVLCGHRGRAEQNQKFAEGKSKLRYPSSRHNRFPSLAVDVAPYFAEEPHIRWDIEHDQYVRDTWMKFSGLVKGIAAMQDVHVRWGGDWGWDFAHWELDR